MCFVQNQKLRRVKGNSMTKEMGKFIVVEGADGAGTTTQAKEITGWLTDKGHKVLQTFEPTGGAVGSVIRKMLTKEIEPLNWKAMYYLFAADRLHHINEHIIPALIEGITVVCDRYYPSTLVYQSLSGGTIGSKERMDKLYSEMFGFHLSSFDLEHQKRGCVTVLEPDVILLLDVDHNVLKARRDSRSDKEELFEESNFQKKVALMYRLWFEKYHANRHEKIDGGLDIDEVSKRCFEVLTEIMEDKWRS